MALKRFMSLRTLVSLVVLLGSLTLGAAAEVVIDFAKAEVGKPITNWVEKGVSFSLSRNPTRSRALGRVMFFPHIGTDQKGILCAMANDPIPVQATFPGDGASSVTLVLWGSIGCPVLVEAFDKEGKRVDQFSRESVPARKSPADPVPSFEVTVKAPEIAYIRFSGQRTGEFLVADELRFTPVSNREK
jgi:hypothetical protein